MPSISRVSCGTPSEYIVCGEMPSEALVCGGMLRTVGCLAGHWKKYETRSETPFDGWSCNRGVER